MQLWDKMSQYRKRDIMKQWEKCQSGMIVAIQVKKSGRFVTATLRPPPGLGGCKIPGGFVWRRYVTVDIVNYRRLRCVDVPWMWECY
jgi:hypothetical protein